jgi:hypothetical protein
VPEIRVATQFVRRIVWQRRSGGDPQAGAALYRDGRSLALRALRLKNGSVQILSAEGEQQVSWTELAELRFPPADPWTAWFDHLAALCPSSGTRLIRAETSSGLIATSSLATFAARFEGNSADPNRWVHGLQPAWSLDILWIPLREIAVYRSFAPHELPLSLVSPQNVSHRGLGVQHAAQIDRSVPGGPLASATLEFGWGFGVAGATNLSFEMPAAARSLRVSVCLDRSAGNGGCVRPRVLLGGDDQPLWAGAVLVGSEKVLDSGRIALPRRDEPRTITLSIDAMIENRPRGADPLEIRDHVNWCDPIVELDLAFVQSEIERRLDRRFVAWRGWTVKSDAAAGLEVSLRANDAIPGSFEPAIRATNRPLVLRRELMPGQSDNWLVIAATRAERQAIEPKIEVYIDGNKVQEFVVPSGGGDLKEVRPLVVPLSAYRGAIPKAVTIEIRQLAEKAASPVEYWAIVITEQLPTLQRLLEDDATPIAADAPADGTAVMVASGSYSGQRALRLTPNGRFRIDLSTVVPVRATPSWGEARFIRLAVRKTGGGRFAIELDDARPRDEPARYDLGSGPPAYGKAVRIWSEPLPEEWIVITRDLYADFGNIDVSGLVVGCPDGESALIDHVYLARSRADLDLTPPVGQASRLP